MTVDKKIFKAYDIRGIYPEEINEENIEIIIKAIYTFFVKKLGKETLEIALGRDMRISSPVISKKAQETLLKLGAKVTDIGLSSTPSVYFAVKKYNLDGGIQISASHNPKQYNGVKFLYQKNNFVTKVAKNTGMEKVCDIALTSQFVTDKPGGQLVIKDILDEEIDFAENTVKVGKLKPFKVVADPANSMGALFLEKIFQGIPGSQLIKINFNLDGSFPAHEANPIKFNTLKELQNKVITEKADFGIATDGDGDRIFFIDEKGAIIPATLITSLIAKEILTEKPEEKILVDIRYLLNAKKIIEKYHGQMEINVVGHSLITTHLNKVGAAFAGESSGHFFFRETGGCESTVRVIYHVLKVLSRENLPISQVIGNLQSAFETGESNYILPESINSKELLEKISLKFPEGKVSWLDGLSIDFDDWRFNIRSSNTEPLIRLNLEALSEIKMNEKLKLLTGLILSYGAEKTD